MLAPSVNGQGRLTLEPHFAQRTLKPSQIVHALINMNK
jgi:hypothetical protein